ncbi:MAG: alpha/beta hydrolase, partial [Proteobacteria bacterium]|nr:alpha/beta hydrolase [Pseudomonadota bacterium]
QSGGSPREEGFYRDGRAVLKFLKQRNISLDRIALYGESLGTAVAIDLAASIRPTCLLLEAPFSSMAALAQHHYWYLPAKWLLLDRFNSAARLATVNAPTLIIHGKQDQIVPLKFAEALAAAAPHSPEFLVVARAGHNDLYDHGVAAKAIAFIESACSTSR